MSVLIAHLSRNEWDRFKVSRGARTPPIASAPAPPDHQAGRRFLEDTWMRRFLIGIMLAATVAAISPVRGQAPPPTAAPWPPAYAGAYQRYPFPAVTPSDAYRQGLISRWELERLEGPTPQALQGPSPNGGNAAPGTGGM